MPLTRGKVLIVVVGAVITAVSVVMSQRSDGTPPSSGAPVSAPTGAPHVDTPSNYDSKCYTRYVATVNGSLADASVDAYCDITGTKWCIIGDECMGP